MIAPDTKHEMKVMAWSSLAAIPIVTGLGLAAAGLGYALVLAAW
jgi:hypothetical protein